MEFEQSSLVREIELIQQSPKKPFYRWTATLHSGDKTMTPYKVVSIDEDKDFETMFAAEVMIKIAVPGGMYAYDIYPGQSDLEITLTKHPLQEMGNASDAERGEVTKRYRAILVETGNPAIEANKNFMPARDALDLTEIKEVEFQLIDKTLEKLRTVLVGGVYRNNTVEEVIRGLLTKESAKLGDDEDSAIRGVDMIKASNQKPRDHIILPHGIPLVVMPEYIQKLCGVYSAGMGYFYHDQHWYVYPCYDTERFNDTKETFTVINVPKNKYPQVERTWRKDGDNLVIMATGDVKYRDNSNQSQLNFGNGVRFLDANEALNFVKTSGNKAIASRAANTSEFTGVARPDGNNIARLADTPITANPYEEYSKLARRNGGVFAFLWENAEPELIKPGMMCKVMMLKDGEIVEMVGVLLKAYTYHHGTQPGIMETRFRTNTMLSIYVKAPKEE